MKRKKDKLMSKATANKIKHRHTMSGSSKPPVLMGLVKKAKKKRKK